MAPGRTVLHRHRIVHPDGRHYDVYGRLDGGFDRWSSTAGADPAPLHRRFDRLTGAWVLISPARNRRPGGSASGPAPDEGPCPLCPGGAELPWPFEVAVFDNRFPSLAAAGPVVGDELTARSDGRCQVVVYTPDHTLRSLTQLSGQQLIELVAVLRQQTQERWAEGYDYVMAFENRGTEVGATLAHLHGQIYALGHLPAAIRGKLDRHAAHRRDEGDCLGCRLVAEDAAREIVGNRSFAVAVPFAARWPLEVHVRARRHGVGRLADLDDAEVIDLAEALHDVVARYDRMYGIDLPYMMCVQEAPRDIALPGDWHLHVEFLPPHRDHDRLKVRASVETALGLFINDTVPELSAARLADADIPQRAWTGLAVPRIEEVE